MAERTCIVTRKVCDPADLIRFVVGPDDTIVPDLKRNLPGRGVWVSASKDIVAQAVVKGGFARSLKKQVKVPDDLAEAVDALLVQNIIGALGFARKAGECVTGAATVDGAVRSNKAIAAFHAADGAEDGLRKLLQAVHATAMEGGRNVKVLRVLTSAQLNMALGVEHVIHAALMNGGAARNCLRRAEQLNRYRESEPS